MRHILMVSSIVFGMGAAACGSKDAAPVATEGATAEESAGSHAAMHSQGAMNGAMQDHAAMPGAMHDHAAMPGTMHDHAAMNGAGHEAMGDGHAAAPGEASGTDAATCAPAASKSVVAAYEAVHAALARDDHGAAVQAAQALATASSDCTGSIAAAAERIAKSTDIEEARLAFGDASKGFIAMLGASPDEAAGLHVFSCPMAKGYQKWVQQSATLANPYMGQRMASCGHATEMVP